MIEIHPTAYVSPKADIEDSIKGSRIVIGAGSYVDSFVKFKAAGGTGDIVIGEQTFINSGCLLCRQWNHDWEQRVDCRKLCLGADEP
jgi:UDP-3-O-[3-hydroxymyristoyl] glucosamine N-acyltransferase